MHGAPPLTSILLNPYLSHLYPLLCWKSRRYAVLKGKCLTFWALVQLVVLLNKHSIYLYCMQATVIDPGEKRQLKENETPSMKG